jgi:large subunit ribosomal protein L20
MPRSAPNVATKRRHKKWIKAAKGYFGRKKNVFQLAKMAVDRARQFAYRDRRDRKGEFRRLWIVRINAGARLCGLSYSRFMAGLTKANIQLDRKVLADLALNDFATFQKIAEIVKAA